MDKDLESLYTQARQALKAKDFSRASDLLRQILLVDENYRDASRLLAQTVTLRRRRWYNDPRLLGAAAIIALIVTGIWFAPRLQGIYASPPAATAIPTNSPTSTLTPTVIPTATETPLPAPTSVPLTWKRVWLGQEFPRDTVTAIAIDPKYPDVLYASMKYAGIYKSIDGGLSWQPSHHGLSNTQVTSLLIDFQNPQILYAGTMGGIFKTEDSSENWSRIGEGNYVLMDPQDRLHLYARDMDNIYETTDQGKSWQAVYSSEVACPGRVYSWAIHPTDGNTLFIVAGMDCDAGIYTSTDHGHTWTPLWLLQRTQSHLIEIAALSVGLDGQGNYYFHFGLLRSGPRFSALIHNDSGIWRTLLEFEPPAAFDSTGSVYFDCDALLCKFDLDKNQRLRMGKPEVGTPTVIAISPHDPNTIYVAGKGISVTKDGGQTWSKRSNGLGGMLLSLETGVGTPPTLYLRQMEEMEAHHGPYDVEPGQPLYISDDGGRTWELSTKTGYHLVKLSMNTWEPILYRIGTGSVWDNKGNAGYWIWRSQDGGNSWSKVTVPEGGGILTAQGGLLYLYLGIYLGDGTAPAYHWEYVSEDYGRKWKTLKPPKDPKPCYGSTLQFVDAYRPIAIDPGDGNHVFVIDDGKLLESHDSCETTEPFATVPNTSMNSIAFDPNQADTLYAGTDSGAYVSFDGGQNWGQINDGLLGATVVYSIVVDKDSNVYAATPYGIFKLEGK